MSEITEIIARGIIIHNSQILLCKNLTEGYYYLPGGHIEKGETSEFALARELGEEIGRKPDKLKFIKQVKNSYQRGDDIFDETFDIYLTTLFDYKDIKSKEDWISFGWVSVDDLLKINFKPQKIVSDIVEIVNLDKNFWS